MKFERLLCIISFFSLCVGCGSPNSSSSLTDSRIFDAVSAEDKVILNRKGMSWIKQWCALNKGGKVIVVSGDPVRVFSGMSAAEIAQSVEQSIARETISGNTLLVLDSLSLQGSGAVGAILSRRKIPGLKIVYTTSRAEQMDMGLSSLDREVAKMDPSLSHHASHSRTVIAFEHQEEHRTFFPRLARTVSLSPHVKSLEWIVLTTEFEPRTALLVGEWLEQSAMLKRRLKARAGAVRTSVTVKPVIGPTRGESSEAKGAETQMGSGYLERQVKLQAFHDIYGDPLLKDDIIKSEKNRFEILQSLARSTDPFERLAIQIYDVPEKIKASKFGLQEARRLRIAGRAVPDKR